MPRRRYSPMKCVPSQGTRDTFDLQQQLIFNILPVQESFQESQIREIDELEFETFDQPTFIHHSPAGKLRTFIFLPFVFSSYNFFCIYACYLLYKLNNT